MQRVPVLSTDGKPLMPMKASRARRFLKKGKAKIVHNDLNIFCIQLLQEPSGTKTQSITIGIDPGKIYRGWVGGFTKTEKAKNVSVYDINWNRIGQFTVSKVKLLQRKTGLLIK